MNNGRKKTTLGSFVEIQSSSKGFDDVTAFDIATAAFVYANHWFAFYVCFAFSHQQQPTILVGANLPRSVEDPMP